MGVSKKTKFEVFKRDKFTCQYCGKKAPDVVLEADHIVAVANGGGDEILNLTTACFDCNRGKSDRPLQDSSVLEKQQAEMERKQERLAQMKMLYEWQLELADLPGQQAGMVADVIERVAVGLSVTQQGKASIRRWIKTHGFETVLRVARETFEKHYQPRGNDVDKFSFEFSFNRIPKNCAIELMKQTNPEEAEFRYAAGILKNRFGMVPWAAYTDLKEQWSSVPGRSPEFFVKLAKVIPSWEDFHKGISGLIEHRKQLDKKYAEARR